jgi:hypothetical protein
MSIREELDQEHYRLVKEMLDNAPESSPTLYHYTTQQSAVYILEGNTLRFTNANYLNDPGEIQAGLKIAEQVFREILNRQSEPNLFADVLGVTWFRVANSFTPYSQRAEKIKPLLDYLKTKLGPVAIEAVVGLLREETYVYLASFSTRSDDLRQWLPYGDNGNGVTIGFRGMKNKVHPITERLDVFLVRVCYETAAKKTEYLHTLLDNSYGILKKYSGKGADIPKILADYSIQMSVDLATDLIACKNHHYKDEEEWRLFYIQSVTQLRQGKEPHPSFYIKNGIIKPYQDIKLQKESIIEIKLGPVCHDLNIDSLRMLGHKKGLKLAISKSEIEYRG